MLIGSNHQLQIDLSETDESTQWTYSPAGDKLTGNNHLLLIDSGEIYLKQKFLPNHNFHLQVNMLIGSNHQLRINSKEINGEEMIPLNLHIHLQVSKLIECNNLPQIIPHEIYLKQMTSPINIRKWSISL